MRTPPNPGRARAAVAVFLLAAACETPVAPIQPDQPAGESPKHGEVVRTVLADAVLALKVADHDGSGLLLDSSGHGNDAELIGSPLLVKDDGPRHFLLTGSQFLRVPHHSSLEAGAGESLTLVVVYSRDVTIADRTTQVLAAKVTSDQPMVGYDFYESRDDAGVSHGVYAEVASKQGFAVVGAGWTPPRTISTVALVRDATSDRLMAVRDRTLKETASPGGHASLETAGPLRIGVNRVERGGFLVARLYGVAVWRRALTPDEIEAAGRELLTPTSSAR